MALPPPQNNFGRNKFFQTLFHSILEAPGGHIILFWFIAHPV